jgi:hypothetical protein
MGLYIVLGDFGEAPYSEYFVLQTASTTTGSALELLYTLQVLVQVRGVVATLAIHQKSNYGPILCLWRFTVKQTTSTHHCGKPSTRSTYRTNSTGEQSHSGSSYYSTTTSLE